MGTNSNRSTTLALRRILRRFAEARTRNKELAMGGWFRRKIPVYSHRLILEQLEDRIVLDAAVPAALTTTPSRITRPRMGQNRPLRPLPQQPRKLRPRPPRQRLRRPRPRITTTRWGRSTTRT